MIAITLDVDWAPDFVIDYAAQCLIQKKVKSTWFVTHRSPAVERLRNNPELFELGIHPNFLEGSSHGKTPEEVIRHCTSLVPEATSMRMHSLVQSTPLLGQILSQTDITTDVSLFLPRAPYIRPIEYHWKGRVLLRVPYYWEDDFEMERANPCWELNSLIDDTEGMKVFNFHPIHIYLNSKDMSCYRRLKESIGSLVDVTPADVTRATSIQKWRGTKTLFLDLVDMMDSRQQMCFMRDAYSAWANT